MHEARASRTESGGSGGEGEHWGECEAQGSPGLGGQEDMIVHFAVRHSQLVQECSGRGGSMAAVDELRSQLHTASTQDAREHPGGRGAHAQASLEHSSVQGQPQDEA